MKKLLIILLTLSVCVGLFANKVPTPTFDLSPTAVITGSTTPNRDLWDILGQFEASAAAMPGVETDGTNIYTTTWNAGTFTRYDMDGTIVGDFSVAGVSNVRDMAYDGTYFYGSAASMSIFIMDLANESLIGTIPVSCAGVTGVRHISYDPGLDGGSGGFWVGNWGEFGAITMSGAQIHATLTNPGDLYGSAYDNWTDGGPYIWLFSQGGVGAVLHQFDIAALATTGVTHDVTDIPGGANPPMAGGLATFINADGVFVMLANLQQDPNLIGIYEITITANPLAPGAPTDVVVTPDAGGALEAVIDWVCPALDVAGDPLTDLDEMRVYRDGALIHTDTNPTIGGAGSYTDASVPASATYTYTVVGFNDADEGFPVSVIAWVGEDVPNVVESLLLEDVGGNGYLTWDNPTTGLNGGPFNEAIIGYHIERSDGTTFEVTGIATEYTDTAVPQFAFSSYIVQPYNSVGDGGIVASNELWFGEGTVFNVYIQCDNYPGETTWEVVEDGGGVLFSGGPYTTQMEIVDVDCILAAGDYTFTIYDAFGDGICCAYGEGFYTLTLGGTVLFEGNGEFADFESTSFTVGSPADPGYIEGTVVIADGAGDVEDVDVEAGGVIVNPEADGTYSIELQPGTYNVTATLVGYDEEIITGVIVTEGNTTSGVDFSLVTDGDEIVIAVTKLNGNYPNPFNPITTIGYSIKDAGNVTLEVFNLRGQLIKTLVNEVKETGNHTINWNGTDNSNKSVSSGVYFYKMVSEGNIGRYTSTKKMILMK